MNRYLLVFLFIKLSCSISFAQYQRQLDSLQKLVITSTNDSIKVDLINDIGGYRVKAHDYNNALDDLLEAQSLAKKINYKNGLSNALQRIGVLLMNKFNYSEAMDYYAKALAIKKEIGDKKGIADVTSNMGIVYSDQGEYSKAIENYFAALKIREEIKDIYGTGISQISIANIYFLQNNYKVALDHYFQALNLKGIYGFRSFIAEVNSNIGLTYFRMNDHVKGLQYFNAAMKIDEELGDKQGIAIAKSDLGNIYAAKRDYETSLKLLNESRELFKEINDKKGLSEIYFELGCIYDSIGQPVKAMECFKEQLSLSQMIGSRMNVKNAYLGLSEICKENNDFKDAYNYFKLFKAMEDSVQNESVNKTVAELESKYNTEKKEKEIALLKAEQKIKDTQSQKRNQLIFGSIAIIITLAVVFVLLYNRNQLQKKNTLERKNFELERNALANQMNPHFIFNSLGSISGFVAGNEKEKAIEYLGVFSKLIRYNLEQSREQLVSVDQEARMLKVYLHLQQLRFDNKFNYEVEVNDDVDATVALPPMFVQPFVENAILHGVIPKEGKGNIFISFKLNEKEELVCTVSDDGIGIDESKKRKSIFNTKQKSLAMTITEERKEIINSKNTEKIRILINEDNNSSATGTEVKLIFPLEYV
jgi:tetratricopeptide (TPR) repeat protein